MSLMGTKGHDWLHCRACHENPGHATCDRGHEEERLYAAMLKANSAQAGLNAISAAISMVMLALECEHTESGGDLLDALGLPRREVYAVDPDGLLDGEQ